MEEKREGKLNKVFRAQHDLVAELYSWSRWFYSYLLPSWLSFPFQFSAGKTLYGLALTALILVYIPSGPLRLLIQESMFDLWKKVVGENSAKALPALLQSFPSEWVFFSIFLLGLWGLIVMFWAWKQNIFFKTVRDAGIRIVRGPGQRRSFFDRLQKAGVTGLGLGPTARLLPAYLLRREDALLRERMSVYRRERLNFGILITGIATSGKTRTAMELLADMKPPLVFIWPRALSISLGLNIPTWSGSAILFADNLTLSMSSGDNPLPAPIMQLLQQCSRMIVVGTIRRNLLPKDLKGLEAIELSEIEQDNPTLQQLAQYVANVETNVSKLNTSSANVMQRYNGHPAGLVAGVNAMRDIYRLLDTDQRTVLSAAKLLRTMGIENLSIERIREVAQLISGKQYSQGGFHDLLDELSETGLIAWSEMASRE